jgi:hypothetical protein
MTNQAHPQEVPELVERLREMLTALEWSGTQRGQGSGYMSSGGDGPLFAACPVCRGLKEPNSHFIQEAVGHRIDCALAAALTPDDGGLS